MKSLVVNNIMYIQDEIISIKYFKEYDISYPVFITHWAIRQVRGLNKRYLQVYFQKLNNNAKVVNLNIACLSDVGEELETLSEITVQDIDTKGMEFSSQIPLNGNTQNVNISISQCSSTDNQIIKISNQHIATNNFKPFDEEDRAVAQRLLPQANGYAAESADGWYCTCGKLNKNESKVCFRCGVRKQVAFESVTADNIQITREQIQKENATAAAVKLRKTITLISILASIAIVAIVLVGVFVSILAPLHKVSTNGITFEKADDGSGYILTDYNGKDKDVVIPEKFRGVPVVGIGDRAFYNCSSLTSIKFGSNIKSIGDYAFSGCSSLKYNEYDNAYYLGNATNKYRVLVKAKNTDITSCNIVADTKFIHSEAFSGCSELTNVVIPQSVTSIAMYAFLGCSDKLTIYCAATSKPSGWAHHWNYRNNDSYCAVVWGFENDYDYTTNNVEYHLKDGKATVIGYQSVISGEVIIPASIEANGINYLVTSIGVNAFADCYNMTSVTIPDSVTSMGRNAFAFCDFESVIIPQSVTSMGSTVFYKCSNLSTIYCEAKSQPSGWEFDWNYNGEEIWIEERDAYIDDSYPVVWGYKG